MSVVSGARERGWTNSKGPKGDHEEGHAKSDSGLVHAESNACDA